MHTLFVAAVDITPSLLPSPVTLRGVSVFSIEDIGEVARSDGGVKKYPQ